MSSKLIWMDGVVLYNLMDQKSVWETITLDVLLKNADSWNLSHKDCTFFLYKCKEHTAVQNEIY